jgi:putative serine protease PepD
VIASTTIDAQSVGAAVVPSIVTVEVGSGSGDTFRKAGSGSGVVLDRNGNVVTNNHVVEAGPTLRVVLSDGRVYEADLVGTDPVTDLAVVRVPTTDLQPITFGSTDGLEVGTPVVAVGSPLGLEGGPSLSLGVVSALGREVQTGPDTTLYGMIQTDAPITSGSSGGSLVDARGNLLGITTAVGVSNIGVEGIGFATPIEVVDRVVEEILTSGTATHAMLGIRGSTDYDETGDGGFEPMGVAVASVAAGSPAQAAGIAEGDVITAVDGTTVRTMDELISVLRTVSAGDTVVVSIAGNGPVSVVLADR